LKSNIVVEDHAVPWY